MKKGTGQFLKIATLIIILASSAGCTTTTKKLTAPKPRIDSATQLAEARQAFNQENYGLAASLLKPLAEQGDADAQYALGYLYHNGLGVPRNYKLAIQWMTAASAKGNEKAVEALRLLSDSGSEIGDDSLSATSTEMEPDTGSMQPIMISGEKPEASQADEPGTAPTIASTDSPEQTDSATETTTEDTAKPSNISKPEPEATRQASDSALSHGDYSDAEKWIMEQPDQHFAIQLIATSNETHMKRFIDENNLGSNAIYYRTSRNEKNWYTLIQGSFDSPSSARNAINNLPATLQNLKPWVKSFSDIKAALSDR